MSSQSEMASQAFREAALDEDILEIPQLPDLFPHGYRLSQTIPSASIQDFENMLDQMEAGIEIPESKQAETLLQACHRVDANDFDKQEGAYRGMLETLQRRGFTGDDEATLDAVRYHVYQAVLTAGMQRIRYDEKTVRLDSLSSHYAGIVLLDEYLDYLEQRLDGAARFAKAYRILCKVFPDVDYHDRVNQERIVFERPALIEPLTNLFAAVNLQRDPEDDLLALDAGPTKKADAEDADESGFVTAPSSPI
jgi:hypothetical protein